MSLWNVDGRKLVEGPGHVSGPMTAKPLPMPIVSLQGLCLREAAYDSDAGLTRITCPLSLHGQTLGALSIARHDHRVQQLVHSSQLTILSLGLESIVMILLMALFVLCAILKPIELWQGYVRVLKAGKVPNQLRLDRTMLGPVGGVFDHLLTSIAGDRFLKDYVHKLTHQYQTPLQHLMNAVLALGELYPEDERLTDITTEMHEELKSLARFNAMVMALAKLEDLKKLSSVSRCALQEIVSHTIASFQHTLEHEQIPVDLALQPCSVWGDDFLIQEAITNLLSNGIEFSRPGDRMTITLDRQKERIQLRIRDRGLGIPEYAQAQIFDRFFTTPRTHRCTTGNGLGLCYVQEIMELHGGQVTVQNHPDGGVEACLFFPARN
jgi:two-component system sensor histidine kinase CreC